MHFCDGWFNGNEIVEFKEKNNEKKRENQQQQQLQQQQWMNVSIFGWLFKIEFKRV